LYRSIGAIDRYPTVGRYAAAAADDNRKITPTNIGADFSFFFLGQRTNSLPAPLPSHPFRSRPINTTRTLGECSKLPQLGLGRSPADKRFGAYWSQKVHLWWQRFLLIFLRTRVIFAKKLDIVQRVQFLTGRRPTRSFSPGAVATIALWKLAPMSTKPKLKPCTPHYFCTSTMPSQPEINTL